MASMDWGAPVFLAVALLTPALHAQQVGDIDLTIRPSNNQIQSKDDPEPSGTSECSHHGTGFVFQGEVKADVQRHVMVAVTKLSDDHPAIGEVVEAQVMLKNVGSAPVTIPWMTDSNHITKEHGDYTEWEDGEFALTLRTNDNEMRLKSLSGNLFSSRFSNGSTLTIALGEWVNVRLKFKLEPEWPSVYGALEPGESQLIAEWRQAVHTYKRTGCEINSGFFEYRKYYHQEQEAALMTAKSNKK